MAKLEGQKIADSYEQLLHTDRDGGGNGTTLVNIKDGKNDNTFALQLATDKVQANGTLTVGVDDTGYDVKFFGDTATNGFMLWDASADDLILGSSSKLGIGTASPSSRLHLYNLGDATNNELLIECDSSSGGATGNNMITMKREDTNRTNEIKFVTHAHSGSAVHKFSLGQTDSDETGVDGTEFYIGRASGGGNPDLTVSSDGDVGIGCVANSGIKLRIEDTNPAIRLQASNDGGSVEFLMYPDQATDNADLRRIKVADGGTMTFESYRSGGYLSDLTLDGATGNIGIGVAPVANRLHIHEADSTQSFAHFTNSTTGTSHDDGLLVGIDADEKANLWNRENTSMLFATNNTQRMTISSAGAVGIGTDSNNNSAKLGIAGNINIGNGQSSSVAYFENSGTDMFIEGNANSLNIGIVGNTQYIMKLDANSRISLSNNNVSGATSNTIFGKLAGNDLVSGGTNNSFFGENAGNSYTTGDNNVAIGFGSGLHNQTGSDNTYVGYGAGLGADGQNHSDNTAVGSEALSSVTTGGNNVAIGKRAGYVIQGASGNTIIGRLAADALNANSNVVIGDSALGTATTATENVAIGSDAMSLVQAGQAISGVVAIGQNALKGGSTTTGVDNSVAIGKDSLKVLTTGASNVAVGYQALDELPTGSYNTAVGHQALHQLDGGETNNTAIGYLAGANADGNGEGTFVGANTSLGTATDNDNVIIGESATGGGANSIVIGADATGQAANSVTLGNASVTDVYMGQGSQANINAGQLTISDTAVDIAANYIGLSNIHTKTAGSSDTSDSFTGLKSYLTFNDADAAFGNMLGADIQAINTTNATGGNSDNIFGVHALTKQDAGNCNNVFGGAFYTDLNDGNLDQSAYGLYVDVDVEAPCEVAGDVIGISVNVDDDDASAGACYGIQVNCASNVDAAIDLVGGGIKFPATQATSSDANTLDDYEEGTFTPTISSGITSVGYHTLAGFYTKIGNLVTVNLYIRVNSGTSNTSNLILDGLPFDNVNTADKIGGFYLIYGANLDDDNSTPPRFQTKVNTNDVEVYKMDGNRFLGSNTDYGDGGTVSALEIRLVGSYFTA